MFPFDCAMHLTTQAGRDHQCLGQIVTWPKMVMTDFSGHVKLLKLKIFIGKDGKNECNSQVEIARDLWVYTWMVTNMCRIMLRDGEMIINT